VTEADKPSARAKKRASAKALREARAARRQVVFEAVAAGWSIEQIADLRKVNPRTVRREMDRALAERRLDAPDRYVHLQVARLTKAVRLADAAIEAGDLKAVGALIKVVRELDRYHGLAALAAASLPAPAEMLPPPPRPLRLTQAAPALAVVAPDAHEPVPAVGEPLEVAASAESEAQAIIPPGESGGSATEERAVGRSSGTRSCGETPEIVCSAPDSVASENGEETEVGAENAPHGDDIGFVTGLGAQGFEIVCPAPERRPLDPFTSPEPAASDRGAETFAASSPRLAIPLVGCAS
jgi:AraC-like DNA-binding protein